MSISGIGNYSYANGYQNVNRTTNQKSENGNSFSSIGTYMNMQYDSNNLAGYLSYKQFYDYMNDSIPQDADSATKETLSSGNGKRIGLITMGDNVYIATYADNSTPENPIVKVGKYEVSVNDVDPKNATELEMFALLSYMDDTNQTNNSGICSFGKIRAYSDLAEQNGICEGIKDKDAICSKKQNWTDIISAIKQIFLGNKETYRQAMDCDNLLLAMSK